jgi:hypothetical protein
MSPSTGVRAALRAWLCGGTLPLPADESQARALIDAAADQGVAGLLDDDPRWPASSRARLQGLRRTLLQRGVWRLELAARAEAGLASRGLRSLPLKGAALDEWLYATPADRGRADVDLLALDDWDASCRVLVDAGFEPGECGDHAWSLRDPLSGLALELHRALTSCPRLHPVDAEGLWARRVAGSGLVKRRPSSEDLLVQLALHAAFQHGLVLSLGQWLDLRRVLERAPLDTRRLADVASAAHARGALATTLLAARAVLDAPPPPGARAAGLLDSPRGVRRWLARRLAEPLMCVIPSRPALARLRWALAAGRRRVLLSDTLWPAGAPASAWRRVAAGAARTVRLARRRL